MLCTDPPIWNDCPFRSAVPSHIVIRRGNTSVIWFSDPIICFEIGNGNCHVDIQMTWSEAENSDLELIVPNIVAPAIYHLTGLKIA
jgi:hypothetical protein